MSLFSCSQGCPALPTPWIVAAAGAEVEVGVYFPLTGSLKLVVFPVPNNAEWFGSHDNIFPLIDSVVFREGC